MLARHCSVLGRLDDQLEGIGFARAGIGPGQIDAIIARPSRGAAIADVDIGEAGDAAVLAMLAGQQCQKIGDLFRRNPHRLARRCIPARDRHLEAWTADGHGAGAVMDGDDAEMIDDLGAEFTDADGNGAAPNTDIALLVVISASPRWLSWPPTKRSAPSVRLVSIWPPPDFGS